MAFIYIQVAKWVPPLVFRSCEVVDLFVLWLNVVDDAMWHALVNFYRSADQDGEWFVIHKSFEDDDLGRKEILTINYGWYLIG